MKLMRELLEREEVGIAVVEPLVAWFKAHQPNADARVAGLMEIISDIRCPISVEEEEKRTQQMHATDVKLAALKMQLNEARDMLDSLVKAQDFNQAATYKTKMTELEAQKQALLAEREAANQATEPFVEKV
jgi:condensin complex subunit 3